MYMSESQPNVVRKSFEAPVRDVMDGASRMEMTIHDHGLVALCLRTLLSVGR